MRAAVIRSFGNADVFNIENISTPQINDDQVLIEAYASSINPVEYKHRKGNHKYILGQKFPIVLGYDVAGKILKCGKNVKAFKPNDLVHCRTDIKYGGAYAEFVVSSEKTLAKIPESIDFNIAAATPLASQTALQALRDKAKITKSDSICIIGAAGGVGHMATQIAKILSRNVTTVCSSKHEKFIEELNPDKAIFYDVMPFPSKDLKFNIVLDASGKYSFPDIKNIIAPHGIFISLLPRPKILFHKILAFFNRRKKVKTHLMKSNGEDLKLIDDWIKNDLLKIKINRSFPLNDISLAHKYAESANIEGKIVIKINEVQPKKEQI